MKRQALAQNKLKGEMFCLILSKGEGGVTHITGGWVPESPNMSPFPGTPLIQRYTNKKLKCYVS